MDRGWYWKGVFIGLIALTAVYLLVPSWYYFRLPAEIRNDKGELEKVLPKWAPARKLNLGLDLQGGIHLVMEVDVNAAMAAKAANRATELKEQLERKGIQGCETRAVDNAQIAVKCQEAKKSEASGVLAEFEDMERRGAQEAGETYAFRPQVIRALRDGAVEQSIKAIRNRIDKFGVTEPVIARRGENHILVQLPGFKDPNQAKELIGKTAQLEFRMLDDEDRSVTNLQSNLPAGITVDYESGGVPFLKSSNQKELQKFMKEKAPADREFLLARIEHPGKDPEYRTYLAKGKAELTGEYLTNAYVQLDTDEAERRPHVALTFNQRGAAIFERLTGENVQKRMAIVLDGIVDSAPVIQQKIAGGHAQITMGGLKSYDETRREAENLALVLKAGALPAPVTIAEQRTVGATLGPELIRSGATAALVGTLLVVLFMMLYYRISGVFADLALVLNGLLILAALALFGASLSLPGIAGMVLTLGVAVDANVIINERIREELHSGKTTRTAVQVGYEKAFAAIFDSNLTTIIAGVVLMQYGTGPVRGFAVTLIIGVAASLFTAIFVVRWLMDLVVAKSPERLSV